MRISLTGFRLPFAIALPAPILDYAVAGEHDSPGRDRPPVAVRPSAGAPPIQLRDDVETGSRQSVWCHDGLAWRPHAPAWRS